MKTVIDVLCLATSLALLSGCGPSPEEHGPADHAHRAADTAHSDDMRWKANPETTEGIRGMSALVEGYPGNGLSGSVLRDSLDERMAMIFERCTMEGEAHEALHRFLLPTMGMIKRIPDGASSMELDSMRGHLRQYDKLFD